MRLKNIIGPLLILCLCVNAVGCSAENVKETSETYKNTLGTTWDKAKETAGNVADTVGTTVGETVEKIGDTAGKLAESAAEEISNAWDAASMAVSQLSLPDFRSGFETAAKYFGTTMTSFGGQKYVDNVAKAINDLQQNIANRVKTGGTIASQAGYVAEEWHAGTYNIDAVARGKGAYAETPKSNGLGSADVVVGDTNASLKYYQTAKESAKQQAKSYFERYNEYKSKTTNPKSMNDWIADNKISVENDPDLYYSIYQDQMRIIPSDQLEAAKEYLKKAIAKESRKDPANRKYVAERDLETLNNLNNRLETADGTKSIPLSKTDAEALVKAAREGDLDDQFLKMNVTLDSSIKGTYIAKQAIKSGATAALVQTAIVIGPEIYEIIKLGIENGQIDGELLKKTGVDGLGAAGEGFLKGSISNALVIMCQAGKLGQEFVNASPELVATLTVLVIDAIKYGIMLCNGDISTETYLDTMAEEVFVCVGSLGTAALVAAILPSATLAIMLGSFVGGLVASAGYTAGKTFALAWIQESDIDLLVPVEAASNAIKDITAYLSIKVSDAISGLKKVKDKTVKNVTIMVYDLTGIQ